MYKFLSGVLLLFVSTGVFADGCFNGTQNIPTNNFGTPKCASDGTLAGSGGGGGTVDQGSAGVTPWPVVLPAVSFVQNLPLTVTPTNKGGTMTTGGTAQTAVASNVSRRGGWIMNDPTATENLCISSTTSATTTGANDDTCLPPGASYSFIQEGLIIQTAISVNAATTGHRWLSVETQ